jgi:hypothetical protein
MNYNYPQQTGSVSAFTQAFLSAANIKRLQHIMTTQLSQVTGNNDMYLVEMTEGLVSAAELFAEQYRAVIPTEDVLFTANLVFSDQMLSQHETRYYETAFWRRWCSQGIPDPNNVPLPLAPERTDFTIETDGYMLSNPVRYTNFPTC